MIKLRKAGNLSSIRLSRDSRDGRIPSKVEASVGLAVAVTMTYLMADLRRATFPL